MVEEEMPDLVVTDLMMPGTDGFGFLVALRDKHCVVPVVAISALDDKEVAVKALQAGAASYFSKQEMSQLLVPTVKMVNELAATHRNRRRITSCLNGMDLRFVLNNDTSLVSPLVRYLEDHIGSLRLCDEHELVRIGVALHESLSNAINHGNLELDSDLRQDDESIYYELAEARKVMWPYCDRKVYFDASLNGERVRFVIRDEGPGFNHQKILDPTAEENMERIGGRGLLLIRSFMDSVSFNGPGNEITLLKYKSAGQKLLAKMGKRSLDMTSHNRETDGRVIVLDQDSANVVNVV